ncbi:MAG: hypothetical protein EPO32_11510 [Anaerolineae bacterium]|nr:MAG: hypothetical protein EPO32_11510 [Anaerolineae bacterium]
MDNLDNLENAEQRNRNLGLTIFGAIAVLVVLVLICALSLSGAPEAGAEGTVTAEAIATQVALTVEAARGTPTATLPPTQTATPGPSDTPAPVATATATFAPEDPRTGLGEPHWRDGFINADNWTLYDNDQSRTEVLSGAFAYTMKQPQEPSNWTITRPEIQNFYLETTATTPGECSGKDRYGLFFRAPDENHGFLFGFSCDGMFRLAKWDSENFEVLIDWTPHDAIRAGANQTNRVGVWLEGDHFRLYANGILLAEFDDAQFNGSNQFGFHIGSENTAEFTVLFDELVYWELE